MTHAAAPPTPRSTAAATAIGFLAVLSWALLALFTVLSGAVPPFQLAALCFAIGAAIGFGAMLAGGRAPLAAASQGPVVWLVGVAGLFGYHFFYFTALRNAPPAEASLIAYLWPLLIVLMSGLLPGERLSPLHVAGAVLGLAGAALIVTKGATVSFEARYAVGYAAAAACALIWSGYSVTSRRLGTVSTDAVAWFCLVAAVLAALCHLALERTHWPDGFGAWLAVLALGLGPVGGAFYVWDVGVKRGDIQLLGVASYAAPLLSTAILVATGLAEARLEIGLAAVLITGGAGLAAYASVGPAARRSGPR